MTSSMLRRQLKNLVQNYSEAEVKVREATSNDPWGPSSSQMADISDLTYNVVACNEIMTMLWKRLKDDRNWRHIHKSLTLLEYLLKTGDDRVLLKMKDNIYIVKALTEYRFVEKDGKDQGLNVREKAKAVLVLMEDDEKLKEEREFAVKTREKMSKGAAASSADALTDPSYKPCYVPGATGLPSLDNIPSVADLTASFQARKEERLRQEAEKKEVERRANMSEDELKWEDAGKGTEAKGNVWGGENSEKEGEKSDPWGAPKEPKEATDPWGTPTRPVTTDTAANSDPWRAPSETKDPFAAPKSEEDPFNQSKNAPDPFNAPKKDPFNMAKEDSDPFKPSKIDQFNTTKDDPFSAPKGDPFTAPKDDPFSAPKDDPSTALVTTPPKDDPFSTTPPKKDPFSPSSRLAQDDPFVVQTSPPKEDPFTVPSTLPKEDSFSAPPVSPPKGDSDVWGAPASPPPPSASDPWGMQSPPQEAKGGDPWGDGTSVSSPLDNSDPFGDSSIPDTDPWGAPTSVAASTSDAWGSPAPPSVSSPSSDPFGDAVSKTSTSSSDPWGTQSTTPSTGTGEQTTQEQEKTGTAAAFLGSVGASLVDLDALFSPNPKPHLLNKPTARTQAIGFFNSWAGAFGPVVPSSAVAGTSCPQTSTPPSSSFCSVAPTAFGATRPSSEAPLFQTVSHSGFTRPQVSPLYSGFGVVQPTTMGGSPHVGLGLNSLTAGMMPSGNQLFVGTGVTQPSFVGGNHQMGGANVGGSTPQSGGAVSFDPRFSSNMNQNNPFF
ncbi:epsin-1-like isoform X2 [Thalassophryne amazonica]|uniref:epsin-1-like isoform X2 n=1 Tax=Thalassophryne amazonica TaxID=390379 RepID=UPI0014718EF1|nr:epsin-1-like isoform X2 [Thalassophryne amazonica]